MLASCCTRGSDSDRRTYVDYNRSGVPLIEIVSEPDMRLAAEAAEFFSKLRHILVWLGVSDGNMEEGSLRCDANVSVRPRGHTKLGTKAEVKNVNSFRYLEKALGPRDRAGRSASDRGAADSVVQETRLWDSSLRGARFSMRSKEEAHDYRYFPEPDLPPVLVDAAADCSVVRATDGRAAGGPPPPVRRPSNGLPEYDAGVLTQSAALADLLRGGGRRLPAISKAASNWVMGELLRDAERARAQPISDVPLLAAIGLWRA